LYEYFEAGLHRNRIRILEIEDLIAAQNRWIVVAPERPASPFRTVSGSRRCICKLIASRPTPQRRDDVAHVLGVQHAADLHLRLPAWCRSAMVVA